MLFWGAPMVYYGYPNKTEKDSDGYDLFNPLGRLIVTNRIIAKTEW